jgi:hypothetical protein
MLWGIIFTNSCSRNREANARGDHYALELGNKSP